jgi:ketosteroid isomerase-like protein
MRDLALWTVVVCLALVGLPAWADDAQVAQEVIALAKAQWAAEIAGKPVSETMKDVADEYTEFNRDIPTRLDGKAVNSRLFEAFLDNSSSKFIAAEMANEKVQVYGDVAILSYNFVGSNVDKDGNVETSLAKSTRIYAKKGGKWMLVHANFAPVD